jgi:hypothetical protein
VFVDIFFQELPYLQVLEILSETLPKGSVYFEQKSPVVKNIADPENF